MSEAEAEALLERIREIMEETELPFGPAVNIYIKEKAVKVTEDGNNT